jgi:hypothetical protein
VSRLLLYLLVAGVFMTAPAAVLAQGPIASPNVEARMWCPSHIETYYEELRAKEFALGEETAEYVRAVEAGWEVFARTQLGPARAQVEALLQAVFDLGQAERESEIMRRVAYGILRNWPAAHPKGPRGDRQPTYLGLTAALLEFGLPGRHTTGLDLLRHTWKIWKQDREAMLRSLWAVTGGDVFDTEYAKWEARWGPDPEQVPQPVPSGYVSEEFDCTWYMGVEYGFLTDATQGHGLRFLAVFVHDGHLLDQPWDGTNTRLVAHFVAEGDTQRAPYPTPMEFAFPREGSAPYFIEDIRWYTYGATGWTQMKAQASSNQSPKISYEFKYPIWDAEHGTWRYADAVVSSSPSPEYRRIHERLRAIKGYGLEVGERMRDDAGDYHPEGKADAQ